VTKIITLDAVEAVQLRRKHIPQLSLASYIRTIHYDAPVSVSHQTSLTAFRILLSKVLGSSYFKEPYRSLLRRYLAVVVTLPDNPHENEGIRDYALAVWLLGLPSTCRPPVPRSEKAPSCSHYVIGPCRSPDAEMRR